MKSYVCRFLSVALLALVLTVAFSSSNLAYAQDKPPFNIIYITESVVKDGKFMEALQFGKEERDFINNKFPSQNVRIYMGRFGQAGKLYLYREFKDFATMEMQMGQLVRDPGYQALYAKMTGLFIEGETYETLMRLVP